MEHLQGSTTFEEEIYLKDGTPEMPGSVIFYHPNDTGNTRLLGSYFNTSHGNLTGYLALPEGNINYDAPYTLATINSTQTFTNKTIDNGEFTGNATFNDEIYLKDTASTLVEVLFL